MSEHVIADTVVIHFADGTSTITHVLADDSIQDHIVELCEAEGWDLDEIADYSIEGQITEE